MIKLSTIRSAKGNSFLVVENNRFHPAGSSTWLTVDDLRCLLAHAPQVEAFIQANQPPIRVMPAPLPPPAYPVMTPSVALSPITITSPEPVPAPVTPAASAPVVQPPPESTLPESSTSPLPEFKGNGRTANRPPTTREARRAALMAEAMGKISGGRFNPA
jgi:hypothetical protein